MRLWALKELVKQGDKNLALLPIFKNFIESIRPEDIKKYFSSLDMAGFIKQILGDPNKEKPDLLLSEWINLLPEKMIRIFILKMKNDDQVHAEIFPLLSAKAKEKCFKVLKKMVRDTSSTTNEKIDIFTQYSAFFRHDKDILEFFTKILKLKSTVSTVRGNAIISLGKVGKEALPILEELIKGETTTLEDRSNAIISLGGVGEAALPILTEIINKPKLPPNKRDNANQNFGVLTPFVASTSFFGDRSNAIYALGGVGEAALPILTKIIDDKNTSVNDRAEALETLKRVVFPYKIYWMYQTFDDFFDEYIYIDYTNKEKFFKKTLKNLLTLHDYELKDLSIAIFSSEIKKQFFLKKLNAIKTHFLTQKIEDNEGLLLLNKFSEKLSTFFFDSDEVLSSLLSITDFTNISEPQTRSGNADVEPLHTPLNGKQVRLVNVEKSVIGRALDALIILKNDNSLPEWAY